VGLEFGQGFWQDLHAPLEVGGPFSILEKTIQSPNLVMELRSQGFVSDLIRG
jgi:hypothetical protein